VGAQERRSLLHVCSNFATDRCASSLRRRLSVVVSLNGLQGQAHAQGITQQRTHHNAGARDSHHNAAQARHYASRRMPRRKRHHTWPSSPECCKEALYASRPTTASRAPFRPISPRRGRGAPRRQGLQSATNLRRRITGRGTVQGGGTGTPFSRRRGEAWSPFRAEGGPGEVPLTRGVPYPSSASDWLGWLG
jgi:hypothetical protein